MGRRLSLEIKIFLHTWSHSLRTKKLHASVTMTAAPVWVPRQRPLDSSLTSVTSVGDDKGDEIVPGAVYRSPDISLRAEETPGKPQLGGRR